MNHRDDNNVAEYDIQNEDKEVEKNDTKIAENEKTPPSGDDDHNNTDTTVHYDEARMPASQNITPSVAGVRGQVEGDQGQQQQQQQERDPSLSEQQSQDTKMSVLDGTIIARPPAPHNKGLARSAPPEALKVKEEGLEVKEEVESSSSSSNNKHRERIIHENEEISLFKGNDIMKSNDTDDDDDTLPPPPPPLQPPTDSSQIPTAARSQHSEPGAYRYSPSTGYHQEASSQSLYAYNNSHYDSSHSLPVEIKRQDTVLLEATLVESTRHTDDAMAKPSELDPVALTALVVEAKEVNVDDDEVIGIRKKSLWIAGAVILLLLVGVGVGVGIVVGGNDDDDDGAAPWVPTIAPENVSPTRSPSNRASGSFRESLPAYTQESLNDATSPQSSALSWLLDSVDLDRYSDLRLVQRFVLATLYFSTNGEEWNDNEGWLTDANECDWSTEDFGSCAGQIYRFLILSERNLVGTLPPEIAMLTLLVELDLGINKLRGSIPTEIALLSNLEALWLDQNRLGGALPTELGTMSTMFVLNVEENEMSGRIPTQLSQLTLLTELWFSANLLTGPFPDWVSTLSNLEFLFLSENRFEGRVPTSLGNLAELRGLELSAFGLTGVFPNELWGSFTEISYFDISKNDLQGYIGSEIRFLTEAVSFDLHTNNFDGTVPIEMGLMQNASYVDLSDNLLTGDIPSELAMLENLEFLYLYDNLFDGSVPEQLCTRVTNDGLYVAIDCDLVSCDCDCACF